MEQPIRSLLVIGIDVTSLAKSANRAGYNVYSVDYFGDTDLRKVCLVYSSVIVQRQNQSCGKLIEQFDPVHLLKLVKSLSRRQKIDGAVLSSGLEDSPEILSALNEYIPIIGNNLSSIKRVRNKIIFFQELKRLKIPHPKTELVKNLDEALKKANDIGYPIVVKPERGFGGLGIKKVLNAASLECALKLALPLSERVLIQEYVQGTPVSASMISTLEKSMTLTINEQLLGMHSLGQHDSFGYCGNIIPLLAPKSTIEWCKNIAERVVSHYGLIGSNGIDFILSEEGEPYVVEVNPRFQGTLECVEQVLGINLLEAHIRACILGVLPQKIKQSNHFCTRLILFAKKRSTIPDLNKFQETRDIPLFGAIVEKGEPICSVIAEGMSKETSLGRAKEVANSIFSLLN